MTGAPHLSCRKNERRSTAPPCLFPIAQAGVCVPGDIRGAVLDVGGHHLTQRRSSDWIVGVKRVRV